MEQVHTWCDELANGDMFVFNCESAAPQKQFDVWLIAKESAWLHTEEEMKSKKAIQL